MKLRHGTMLAATVLALSGGLAGASSSSAALSRLEAEAIPTSSSCWSVLAFVSLSGGQGRVCSAADDTLQWTVPVPAQQRGTIRLYAYRDDVPRGYRVRVDGGAWAQGTLAGAYAPSALFYVSADLPEGSHTIELQAVPGAGGFTFDYQELETVGTVSSTTATTLATTTTTTAPPATTTTTAPPATTTTTTAPPATTTTTAPPATTTTTAPPATTTTTAPPATTTTTARRPTTTTTAPPATTTTTAPPGVCNIAPADGQAAIASAIEACPNGTTVRFPAGKTYHQTDKINVVGRVNLTIDGNGSTFASAAPNDGAASIYQARPNWQVVEGTNVTLRNMTVRGNLPAGPRGMLPGNQYNSGIMIYGGNGISVTDVSVYSVFGEFVVANPSGFYRGGGALEGQVPTNVSITRLVGQGAARQCVSATAAQGFWLQDSKLGNCYQNGVDLEPDAAGERIRDAHILRNTISGYYFSAITVPTTYQSGDVDGVEIRGNTTTSTSDTCYPGVLLGGVQDNANLLYNLVVADNTLRTLYEGVKDTYVASGSVTGNNITITVSPAYCGPPTALPIRLINSPNVTVASNATTGYGG